MPHTPRRFPLRSGQLSTRHEHKRASYLMLVQQSHPHFPVPTRYGVRRLTCVYAPAMYTIVDTRRTASARVNAPTAYTAHPACVYAPNTHYRSRVNAPHPPRTRVYTGRPRGVHACSLPATCVYRTIHTHSVYRTIHTHVRIRRHLRARVNAPTCVYICTYRSRTYPPTARVNAPT